MCGCRIGMAEVGCLEGCWLLWRGEVFEEVAELWVVEGSEFVLVVAVSVIEDGLFCNGCCVVVMNCSRKLWGVELAKLVSRVCGTKLLCRR